MSGVDVLLGGVFAETLRGFDLRARVRRAIGVRGDLGPFRAIAIGKAALPMFEGALETGIVYDEALVVVPDGVVSEKVMPRGATIVTAAHPVPDERSVRAGEAALDLAGRSDTGTLHVFVSGGASALACVPAAPITLEQKVYVTRALLGAGADIRELNVVRRHLSRLKGGGLLRVARGRVFTAVVSDVVGGAPWDIGSGPSSVDPTTAAEARVVLDRVVPELGPLPLVETLKPGAPEARLADLAIVADADAFLAAFADRLRDRGLSAITAAPITLDVSHAADVVVDLARGLGRGQAVLFSAEPTVTLPERPGRGGRATHLALLVAERLPSDVALLAGATDGVDGVSGTGGAVVTRRSLEGASAAEIAAASATFDAGALLERAGATLRGGPTGLNFSDVVAIARA